MSFGIRGLPRSYQIGLRYRLAPESRSGSSLLSLRDIGERWPLGWVREDVDTCLSSVLESVPLAQDRVCCLPGVLSEGKRERDAAERQHHLGVHLSPLISQVYTGPGWHVTCRGNQCSAGTAEEQPHRRRGLWGQKGLGPRPNAVGTPWASAGSSVNVVVTLSWETLTNGAPSLFTLGGQDAPFLLLPLPAWLLGPEDCLF